MNLNDLKIKFEYNVDSEDSEYSAIKNIKGLIYYDDLNEYYEPIKKIEVGTISGYKIDAFYDYSFELLESIGPDHETIADAIEKLISNSEEYESHFSYLILDRVYIEEEYRNKGVGSFAIKKFIQNFSLSFEGFYTFVQPAYIEKTKPSSEGLVLYSDPNETPEKKELKLSTKKRLKEFYSKKFGFKEITKDVLVREDCFEFDEDRA